MQIHFTPVPFRLLAFQPCRLREPDKLCQRKFLKSLLKFSSLDMFQETLSWESGTCQVP